MSRDRAEEPRNEPRTEEREPRERIVAPPTEREHETQEGAIEEDEQRKRKGGVSPPDPDRT